MEAAAREGTGKEVRENNNIADSDASECNNSISSSVPVNPMQESIGETQATDIN